MQTPIWLFVSGDRYGPCRLCSPCHRLQPNFRIPCPEMWNCLRSEQIYTATTLPTPQGRNKTNAMSNRAWIRPRTELRAYTRAYPSGTSVFRLSLFFLTLAAFRSRDLKLGPCALSSDVTPSAVYALSDSDNPTAPNIVLSLFLLGHSCVAPSESIHPSSRLSFERDFFHQPYRLFFLLFVGLCPLRLTVHPSTKMSH